MPRRKAAKPSEPEGPSSPVVPSKTHMRRFYLKREVDASGVSGTGVVAEGVAFSNGFCALTWLTHLSCNAFYHSVDVLEAIHGHEGATKVVWIDEAGGSSSAPAE